MSNTYSTTIQLPFFISQYKKILIATMPLPSSMKASNLL